MLAVYKWSPEESGWFVLGLQLYNSPPWNAHTAENLMNDDDLVFFLWPSDLDLDTKTVADAPLLNWSRKPKVYKTLEYLRRDMTAIAGQGTMVLMMEYVDKPLDDYEQTT